MLMSFLIPTLVHNLRTGRDRDQVFDVFAGFLTLLRTPKSQNERSPVQWGPMPLIRVIPIISMLTLTLGALATRFKERGLDMEYVEVKGGTHPTAVEIAMPKIFDFFNRHGAR